MFPELIEWAVNLEREFVFLLLLPFAVAFAGFLAEARGRRTADNDASASKRNERSGRMTGAWSRGL
jgi:hypothetical protein